MALATQGCLGPLASACHLDATGIIAACEVICRDIVAGCDLVVLSKFGQLEARRTGLIDAFATAVGHGKPILTAVSPLYGREWDAFSAPLSTFVAPDEEALDLWQQRYASTTRFDACPADEIGRAAIVAGRYSEVAAPATRTGSGR